MSIKKSPPLLQPYGRSISTRWIGCSVIFLFFFILFVAGGSISLINADCCLFNGSRGLVASGGPDKILWQIAVPFFIVSVTIGFLIVRTYIKNKVEQGRWLSRQDRTNNTPSRAISMTTGSRIIGSVILTLLFMLSVFLGTVVLYSLGGFLTGGAAAFLLRSIKDLAMDIGIYPKSGQVTQHSMQKYLELEYGSARWKLLEEARKDPTSWREQVRTQKGLEEWAKATCHELGYPPYPGRIERKYQKRKRK